MNNILALMVAQFMPNSTPHFTSARLPREACAHPNTPFTAVPTQLELNPAPLAAPMTTQTTPQAKQPHHLRRQSFLALAGLLIAGSLQAQSAAPAKQETATEDETIVLSPFTVDSSKDRGYHATNTLAGSRVNTQLKDIPASISVVTKEFMDDIGAVGVNDIVAYTANTEGTREYTNAPAGVGGKMMDGVSQNPNESNRVRGLASADTTRDYFYTINWTGFDTYNLDQVTLNRGPNSALAGLGSPAGIINYAPQEALLSKTKGDATLRFGSWGDKRATINSNHVLIPGTLAVRFAVALNDVGYKQQPSFQHEDRLYGAITYKPWKRTTLHASFEHVDIHANRPNSLTPEDDVSDWIAGGKPVYDSKSGTNALNSLNMWNWVDGALLVIRNKNGQLENSYVASTQYVLGQKNKNNVALFVSPVHLSDNTYLQLDKINLQPSNEWRHYNAFNFSLDQEILKNLNANIAYVHEQYYGNSVNFFRPEYSALNVDANKYLPDGSPNPHVGEFYMQFRGLDNRQFDWNNNDVGRASLSYDLDLTQYNKWFGHWQATAFAEQRETNFRHEQFTALGLSSAQATTEVSYRYYLGGDATTQATASPGSIGASTGLTQAYYNSATGKWDTTSLSTAYYRKGDARTIKKLGSEAAVLQGRYWDNRIVGTWGVRRDKEQEGSNTVSRDPLPEAGLASESFVLSKASKTTQTYGVVVHATDWLSFHYNRAQNWVPHGSAIDLLGNATPSPSGTGRDLGFSLELIKHKLNVKFNWYDLTSANDSDSIKDSVNMPLAQWALPYLDLYKMPSIAAYYGITYKKGIADGIILGDSRLYNSYTSSSVSKGKEVELTYNINDNWRLMATFSQQDAKQSNIATGLTAFIEERLAYWKSIPGLWDKYLLPIESDPNHTKDPWWSYGMTGKEVWENWSYQAEYLTYKAYDGKPNGQLAKYHGSLVTNYRFTQGPMKGFNMGLGARYIHRAIIGTPAFTNSSGTVTGLDVDHPYYSPSYVAWDAWVGYKFRPSFLGGKRELSFQLNGRDLQEGGGFRSIVANSDGTRAVFRIIQPRSFYFTTRIDF